MRELLIDYITSLQDRINDLMNTNSHDNILEAEILQDVVEELVEIICK